jgi:precorrin-6B methylase 2
VQERGGAEVSKNARYSDNFHYATIGYLSVRKVLRVVKPGPQDVFCDIGSGMGRILCVVAREPVRKCVGVELLEPLCQIARRNAISLRGRKAPIQIVCGDATTVDLSEGTIYFMFNPFGGETLRDTLENIRCSLSQKPRAIRIAYYNSKYQSVLEALGWLVKVHEFDTFGGHRVTFWENRNSQDKPDLRNSAVWHYIGGKRGHGGIVNPPRNRNDESGSPPPTANASEFYPNH